MLWCFFLFLLRCGVFFLSKALCFSCRCVLGRYCRCWRAVLPLISGTTAGDGWYYHGKWYYRHTSAVLPLMSGTTATQRGTTAAGRGQGFLSGQGEVSSPPYPFARPLVPLPLCSTVPPRKGSGGSPPPGRSSPFPSVESIPTTSSCHGCRYCPRSSSLRV